LQKHLTESVRGHLAKHPSVPIIQCAGAILQLARIAGVYKQRDRAGAGKDFMQELQLLGPQRTERALRPGLHHKDMLPRMPITRRGS
jgi:hypothetical protein